MAALEVYYVRALFYETSSALNWEKKTLITFKNFRDAFELIFDGMAPNGPASYTLLAGWLTG